MCLSLSQVVQEYERAVIFRLGRIKSSKAHGPGIKVNLQIVNIITKRTLV